MIDTKILEYGYRDPEIWIKEIPEYGYRNPGVLIQRS